MRRLGAPGSRFPALVAGGGSLEKRLVAYDRASAAGIWHRLSWVLQQSLEKC